MTKSIRISTPFSLLALLLVLFVSTVAAIYEDDAGVLDWHRTQIGLTSAVYTPAASGASDYVGVYTESDIFAVLHAANGSIAWRRSFSDGGVKAHCVLSLPGTTDLLVAITRPAGNSILYRTAWADGSLDWELSTMGQITALGASGESLLVGEASGDIHVIETSGIKQFTVSSNGATVVAIEDGVVFAEQNDAVTVSTVDIDSQSLVEVARFEGSFVSVESEILVLRNADSLVIVKLGEDLQAIDSITESDVESVAVSEKVVVLNSASGAATVYDRESLGELNHLEASATTVAPGAEAETFAVLTAENELNIINGVTNAVISTTKLSISSPVLTISAVGNDYLVQYSNGILQLVSESSFVWERDESIAASPIAGLFVQLPETAALDIAAGIREEILLDDASDSNVNILLAYVKRVTRHLNDFQAFPRYVIRTLQSSFMAVDEVELERANMFGLHQYFVLVSGRTGRVVALDTFLKGETVWALDGVDVGAENGKDTTVRLIGTDVYIVTKTGIVTVINALTGEITKTKQILSTDQVILKVVEIPSGLYAWTTSDELVRIHETAAPTEIYYTNRVNEDSVWGYMISVGAEGNLVLTKTWSFNLDDGYTVATTAMRPQLDKTVNIGQVLKDRRVMYKYLHANLLSIAAINSEERRLQVFLLDTVTGRVLHAKAHNEIDSARDIALAQGEHWLVYTYTAAAPTLGEQLTIWDLYESKLAGNTGLLVSGPTALESTTLVAAAGTDVYVVRVTPSKPFDVLNTIAFSKQQLIYTVAAMLAVVGYLRPQVGKKRANAKWGVE
ncbi:hypothetical protein D0Z00_000608 [Geotrichum galactomycetum]|uniref:Uncharacterized protein n=1 Tax=Geotrichum galactomycetum TaxID=27317 RepID=A0ACB6V9C2_9ASCO|nr:hypothetical protein D0Z00_000608 [Geotrichum candidum]